MRVGLITGYGQLGYSSIDYFYDQIERVFRQLGSSIERHDYSGTAQRLVENPPDITIGIGTHLHLLGKSPVFDVTERPHISWVIDSPVPMGISYIRSPHLHYVTIDRQHSDFLEERGGTADFVPLGTTQPKEGKPHADREMGVVFTGHLPDPEGVREKWAEHGERTVGWLNEALECALADMNTPLLNHVRAYMNSRGIAVGEDNGNEVFFYKHLNDYLRGYKRQITLDAIDDVAVHIFGGCDAKPLLEKRNFIFHGSIDYMKTFEVFDECRLAINVAPNYYDGCHDRAIVPISSGAASLTDENRYLREHFEHGESMLFYDFHQLDGLNDQLAGLMSDPRRSEAMAQAAIPTIKERFTWEARLGEMHTICGGLVERGDAIRARKERIHRFDEAVAYLKAAADAFRDGNAGLGNVSVMQGIEGVIGLLAENSDPLFTQRLSTLINTLVNAQTQGHAASAAELLDRELIPLLGDQREALVG